jgi:hypothetical protein
MGVKILGVEDAAVFGAGDVEAVLGAEFGDDGFADAEFAVLALYYGVLETGGFGEDEEGLFGGRKYAAREREARGGGGDGANKSSAIEENGHVKPQRGRILQSESATHCIPEQGCCWLDFRKERGGGRWLALVERRRGENIFGVECASLEVVCRKAGASTRLKGQ